MRKRPTNPAARSVHDLADDGIMWETVWTHGFARVANEPQIPVLICEKSF